MTTCFIAMGFGEKTAFYGGKKKQRLLNLDRTYENIIKPAVLAAGLICVRADEIIHSTLIDKPMYEYLLQADIVIADLSTSNANAIYELGVRHALRPWTTIVMAEKEFAFPFDLGHLSILRYEHLGPDIGAGEARRMVKELQERLLAIAAKDEVDSPVYLFLPTLARDPAPGQRSSVASPAAFSTSVAGLHDAFLAAKSAGDWPHTVASLQAWNELQPDDPYVLQQLALATYKSEIPDRVTALRRAREVLTALDPRLSSDAETVGLWGAIHKRLWEAAGLRDDLDGGIRAYLRGFLLRNDYYNGINYAFLLDVRASQSADDDAIADRVLAARARREVLQICHERLDGAVSAEISADERYWLRATKAEALFGLGQRDAAKKALDQAKAECPCPAEWMITSTEEQLRKLGTLL